ncbi:MAG TPA: hypothetical protein VN673_03390, partial [Clostridia bacterium]|nr:hypothetical protein [Clostridia bacterium]
MTLTASEIVLDVMDAFKTEIPMMLSEFATDFSSKTAVKGDTIIAHISSLPTVQDYHNVTGFANGAQAAEGLLADVPVVLNTLKHVPVKISWLTQLASRLPLYREAVRNSGYVLAKMVVDEVLSQVVTNFSNTYQQTPAMASLDAIENIRSACNVQGIAPAGRFGIVNSAFAAALQGDDRIGSKTFVGQLNASEAYRRFTNVAGFKQIFEYPDFPTANNAVGFVADRRACCVAIRRPDFSSAAAELGIPQVMRFTPVSDPGTGIEMAAIEWQEAGTGDVYVTLAVLFGVGVGNQGGAPGSITD